MVFIVKIPNHSRSRGGTPDPSSSSEVPEVSEPVPMSLTRSDSAAPSAAPMAHAAGDDSKAGQASSAPAAAALDILLAPAVLHHRYVRGVDKSLIVERPERVRAVLLGIAGAIGRLPAESPGDGATAPAPAALQQDADDDLVAKLSSLSVGGTSGERARQAPPFRVLHSTRSLSLDPPHPSVAYVHARSDEAVEVLEPAYHEAKRKRQQARQLKLESDEDPTITASSAASRGGGETAVQSTAASLPSPPSSSHAAYVQHLATRAPCSPPQSQAQSAAAEARQPSSSDAKSTGSATSTAGDESDDYTSSDGEGDEAMHPSEIPSHLPQGDLYLAGPTDADDGGGSSHAIRHAMGACAEAVDRVVAAASAERERTSDAASARLASLPEVGYDEARSESGPHESASAPSVGTSKDAPPAKRVFVLSRPPGHHCAGSTPSGFCWVNNAVVAAAHGYLEHGIDRVVVFDIDLHHGNGTQTLAWRINADSQRHDLDRDAQLAALRASAIERNRAAIKAGPRGQRGAAAAAASLVDEKALEAQVGPRGLRIFYSSIHDIESFPCEDGDPDLIKDASVCVEGAHGQWIWNVHLDHYTDEADFYRLYDERYAILFAKAARFLSKTDARPESTLILISAGFDACSYEYPGMQRHGKHVPPSFYDRFARDAIRFSEGTAEGKLVSVLEGGYSDRALCSAAMAHVSGLALVPPLSSLPSRQESSRASTSANPPVEDPAWKLDNLIHLEKMAKKMAAAAAAASVGGTSTPSASRRRGPEPPAWVVRSSRAFAAFERACGKSSVVPLGVAPRSSMGEATKRGGRKTVSAVASTTSSPVGTAAASGRVLRDRSALKARSTWDPSSPTTTPKGSGGGEGGRGSMTSPRRVKGGVAASNAAAGAGGRQAVPSVPLASSAAAMVTGGGVPGNAASWSNDALSTPTPVKDEPTWRTPEPFGSQTTGSASSPVPAAAQGIKTESSPTAPSASAPTTAPPPPNPSTTLPDDRTTSRIGSVTPKAVGIQTTPVTLVDAMYNAFGPSASSRSSPSSSSLPSSTVAPSSFATREATQVRGEGYDDARLAFAAGLQEWRSSLGLEVEPVLAPRLGVGSGSYSVHVGGAAAGDGGGEATSGNGEHGTQADAMAFYKAQMAAQAQRARGDQQLPPPPPPQPLSSMLLYGPASSSEDVEPYRSYPAPSSAAATQWQTMQAHPPPRAAAPPNPAAATATATAREEGRIYPVLPPPPPQ